MGAGYMTKSCEEGSGYRNTQNEKGSDQISRPSWIGMSAVMT
ncbi:hypothetical protein LEP1GSC047_2338 [Leptospira inadai serovar Lyme str. 10]|uniref:Uncharacterized protein n=1 Tax=Leptospira inadai serovar Lyme str. 10 TaxID=1049790 RepID=V6HZF3_9LEPT|nr:hypothetical protein LEP1GSC047_2338 [Leptospira inadai serovar Lyme str. 10]